MDTNRLKKFATEARKNLMEGVMRRLRVLGFDDKGNVIGKEPELISGATLWRGDEYPEDFHAQWTELAHQLRTRGVREVVEEAAYIWFNRMIAIRILAKNNLCEPILIQDETTGMPKLLADARMNMIPEMDAQHRRRFDKLMDDDTKTIEQFTALISAWCKENPIISSCFGSHKDYVELLLPDNITKPNGFLSLLNNTGFIADADYRSAELIGWLYQFYISDRKDEVFAKKGAYTADEIPAATQIFTPNWIVKYMVQNTILPQVDAPEEIIEEAKYLVKNPDAQPCRKVELEDFKVADFACGSGHILNECFDLLFKLYREEGYSRREAIENIFTKNLTGIDIDLRAKQLATFALLLKACQRDESFADAHCLPYVLTVPDINDSVIGGNYPAYLQHFFLGSLTKEASEQLTEAFRLLEDAPTLGSIIKFDLSSSTHRQLVEAMQHWQSQSNIPYGIAVGIPAMEFILTLSNNYDAIIMNPPYMGSDKMDVELREYALKHYYDTANDLGAVFMEVCYNRLSNSGKFAMINQAAWMLKPAYKIYREHIIENERYCLDNAIYLGPNTFDELRGEVVQSVVFVVSKATRSNAIFFYDKKGNSTNKKARFLEKSCRSFVKDLFVFKGFPGIQFGFWINDEVIKTFSTNPISSYGDAKQGMKTGDNSRFIRLWTEISRIKFNSKWFPVETGGKYRKWYGNGIAVLNWENDGFEVKNFKDEKGKLRSRPQGLSYSFMNGITWSTSASDRPSFRFSDDRFLFESSGSKFFTNQEDVSLSAFCAYFNSPVVKSFLEMLSPGLGISEGAIKSLPFIEIDTEISRFADNNISISREDWDAHEISWDFQTSPLIAAKGMCIGNGADLDALSEEDRKEILADRNIPTDPNKLEDCYKAYCNHWARQFNRLHRNEEELNRRFIKIYGLQDELTPDVPLDEVTILQQGEIKIVNSDSGVVQIDGGHSIPCEIPTHIEFQPDVIIKQLISYIIGVWMGRYRLDRPGLNIAHPNPTEDELAEYAAPYGKLKIDVDAIIPILPQDAPFFDNLYNYVRDFLRLAFGEESLIENLNFIEKCLGKRLDIYLQKDFWKDHKKMYQNKPIYWLFSSSKGAFQAIIYAHRMDRYTIEVMRSKYLLPYRSFVEKKIAALDARAAELSTAERKELDRLRKDIAELDEYAQRVEVVAGESAQRDPVFDLDDGIAHNHALFGDIATKLK